MSIKICSSSLRVYNECIIYISSQIDYDLMSMEINRKILKCRLCHKWRKKEQHWKFKSYHVFLFDNNCVHVVIRNNNRSNAEKKSRGCEKSRANGIIYYKQESSRSIGKNSTWNCIWSVTQMTHEWLFPVLHTAKSDNVIKNWLVKFLLIRFRKLNCM